MDQQENLVTDFSTSLSPVNDSFTGGKAALTEANRHTDILFTSLAGVAAIVVVLLVGIAAPKLFNAQPIHSTTIILIMVFTSMAGVAELCFINYRAHRHVTNQARLTEVLLNSLGQGYLSFDASGICGRVYSQACLELLESAPGERHIAEVLRLSDEQKLEFQDWLAILFMPDHALSFDDVAKFLPQTIDHSQGRHVALLYRPVRNNDGTMFSVVVIATDQTDEVEAQKKAREQQNFVSMISSVFRERNQFLVTLTHLRKFVEDAETPIGRANAAAILRLLHTLKASTKHFHMQDLSDVICKLEVDLRDEALQTDEAFQVRLRDGGKRVAEGIESVLQQVGELIGRDYEGRGTLHEIEEGVIYDFANEMIEKNVSPELVRHYLSTMAAVPINDCFRVFERELNDLGVIMGKKLKPVRYTGSNPRVLSRPLENLILSLMHICRNIIDHGIEPAVTRIARGKEPSGQITIHTEIMVEPLKGGQWLRIVISDDGNGIDPALLRDKLAKIDPNGAWQNEDDKTVIQRILSWGVSTKDAVTELSGRGIGMEAVEREVVLLGGTIKVASELYLGTTFDIRIPYSIELPQRVEPAA